MVAKLNPLLNSALKYENSRRRVNELNRLQTPSDINSSLLKTRQGAVEDSLSLSEPLKMLKDMGLDFEKSSFGQVNQSLDFNLQFSDDQISGLTSKGSYDLHSRSLLVDLSFSSIISTTDMETSETRKELFQFEFHLETSEIQIGLGDEQAGSEDILPFAEKMLKKLSKMIDPEDGQANRLLLDNEHMKQLAAGNELDFLKGIKKVLHLLQKIDHCRGRNTEIGRSTFDTGKAQTEEGLQVEAKSLEMSLTVQRVSQIMIPVNSANQTDYEQAEGDNSEGF